MQEGLNNSFHFIKTMPNGIVSHGTVLAPIYFSSIKTLLSPDSGIESRVTAFNRLNRDTINAFKSRFDADSPCVKSGFDGDPRDFQALKTTLVDYVRQNSHYVGNDDSCNKDYNDRSTRFEAVMDYLDLLSQVESTDLERIGQIETEVAEALKQVFPADADRIIQAYIDRTSG